MKTARKIKYYRILRKRLAKIIRNDRSSTVCKFMLDQHNNKKLFTILSNRKPLKIITRNLPSFTLPKTVKVVISGRNNNGKYTYMIPFQEEEQGAMLTQVPAKEFLFYNGDLGLSIAQMKLNDDDAKIPQFVKQYFKVKRCGIEQSTIQAINLWFYKGKRLSTWHYDGHDNFLFMLKGRKVIHLMPPDVITPKSVFNINNNHSQDDATKQAISDRRIRCELKKGQCLFIPRGWWHQVHSYGQPNIAINIWGNSLSKVILHHEEEMMLRHLIFSFSDKLSKEVPSWSELPEKIREQYRRTNFQIYLQSPTLINQTLIDKDKS